MPAGSGVVKKCANRPGGTWGRATSAALLALVLAAGTAVTGGWGAAAPAEAAAKPSCSAFSASVTDRVNPGTQAQLLTYRTAEATSYAKRGFSTNRGNAMTVATRAGTGLSAVHRLYRAARHDYLYTAVAAERKRAVAGGYRDQGVAFYASRTTTGCLIPVYGFVRSGVHRYSTLPGERALLRDSHWRSEGIRFYVLRPRTDTTFALGVMPDTQQEVLRSSDTRFANRSRWFAAARAWLDLRFVTHTGDVVNWDTSDHAQYKRAAAALKPLSAAHIPYSLSPGNHDTAAVCAGGGACDASATRRLVRKTTSFNHYLGTGTADVKGRYESSKVDNSYSTFTAGGARWLVLNLELWPRTGVVGWAQKVVAQHPRHNVIVVTHSYLTSAGAISGSHGYGDASPRYLYDHLVKVYPNVRVVLSGHTGKQAARTDVGQHGNRIVSLLLTMHDNHTNPLRLIEINTSSGSLSTWVYSPYSRKSYPSYSGGYGGMRWIRS